MEESKNKREIPEFKKKVVEEFKDLIEKYPIVGVLNLQSLPAPQLQRMRELLRNKVEIKMTKKRLMKIAFDSSKKKNIKELEKHFIGMPALLFSNENPFSLYKIIKKNKSKAPAKAGQIAPNDIIVNAGPTSFAPGPIISELSSLGLKTGVENGKIVIKEDKVVVKQGDVISEKCASVLTRLGIEPMEVGLDLVAVYEDGNILLKDVLDIDEEKFIGQLSQAHSWAFNLAYNIGYYTKDNIELFINNAFKDALALALDREVVCKETIENLIIKATRIANELKSKAQ